MNHPINCAYRKPNKIKCIDTKNNSTILYNSLEDVAKQFNYSSSLISYYCMNNNLYNNRFKFEYQNNKQGRKIYPWEPVVQLNNDNNSFIKL